MDIYGQTSIIRSFFKLKSGTTVNKNAFFYNSDIFSTTDGNHINVKLPENYQKIGIVINSERWKFKVEI